MDLFGLLSCRGLMLSFCCTQRISLVWVIESVGVQGNEDIQSLEIFRAGGLVASEALQVWLQASFHSICEKSASLMDLCMRKRQNMGQECVAHFFFNVTCNCTGGL